MLKILHTSDIHIGAPFKFLGENAGVYRNRIKKSFESLVDICIAEGVNLLLLPGDIFDTPYPSEINTTFFRDQLFKLSDNSIRTVILPGNHDNLEVGSVFTKTEMFQNDPNIFVFDSLKKKEIRIEALEVTIFANATTDKNSKDCPFKGLPELIDRCTDKYKVVMGHGSYSDMGHKTDAYPFSKEDLNTLSKAQYVALGDWHGYLDVSTPSVKAIYPGSIEPIQFDQENSGNVVLVTISDDLKTSIEKRRVGTATILSKIINLEEIESADSLIKDLLKLSGENSILQVELKGVNTKGINFEELKEHLNPKFFYIDFKDSSESVVDFSKINYQDHTILNEFVKLLKEKEKSGEYDNSTISKTLEMGVSLMTKNDNTKS